MAGIVTAFKDEGIPCFVGSCSEIYNEKAFEIADLRPKRALPVAKELGETTLMFLIHPTLTRDEMKATCEAIDKIMTLASK